MRSLSKFGKSLAPVVRQVGPLLQRAAPGAIQGAMTGMVAGPKGALVGAGIGAVTSLLAQPSANPAASRAPQQVAPPPTPVPQQPLPARQSSPPMPYTTMPAPAAMNANGRAAVTQLLALLSRPETMQALSALLMGASGRQQVRVGARQAPVAAFANAISEYAAEIVEQADPVDLIDDETLTALTESGVDVASPSSRADALLTELLDGALINHGLPSNTH